MKKIITLFLIILIIIILLILLHVLKKSQERFLDYNLPFPSINYNNNVSNYQFINKSLIYPNWNHQPKGWYQWWKKNQSNGCLSNNNNSTIIPKPPKITFNQLFYDGIWKANNHLNNFCNSWVLRTKGMPNN